MGSIARRRPLVTDGAAKVDQLGGKITFLNNQNSGGPQVGEPICADLIGSDQCRAAGTTAHGPSPVLALCRELVAAKVNPDRPLHVYRGDMLCLVVHSIGEAAHLDINSKGTGFVRCRQAVRIAPPITPREAREAKPPNERKRTKMKDYRKCGTQADLREFVEAAIQNLAAKGLIRDSGRRRKGQIVWVATGKPYSDDDDPKAA